MFFMESEHPVCFSQSPIVHLKSRHYEKVHIFSLVTTKKNLENLENFPKILWKFSKILEFLKIFQNELNLFKFIFRIRKILKIWGKFGGNFAVTQEDI